MIVLIHSSGNPSKAKKLIKRSNSYRYIFLSEDSEQSIRWDKVLSLCCQGFQTTGILNETVNELRKPFLEFMGELNAKYNSPDWWMSRIAEQNTMVSSFFIYCCKLELIRKLVSGEKEQNLIIIADNWALLKSISRLVGSTGVKCNFVGRFHSLTQWGINILGFALGQVKFLILSLKMYYAARKTQGINSSSQAYNIKENSKQILLHTWVDEASFGGDDIFVDRYFGRLLDWLEDNGYRVNVIPYLYSIKRPIRDALKWLRLSNKNFIIPQDYYKFKDYLRAIKTSLKLLFLPSAKVSFLGMDVTELIRQERWLYAASAMYPSMYRDLAIRLKKAGYHFTYLIDVYEGMIPEKALLLGMREAFPETISIGFQHSIVSKNLLCYFIHQTKFASSILPDLIICNGQFTKKIFEQEGLAREKLVVGCALRHEYLGKSESEGVNKHLENKKNILVTLPLTSNAASDILHKLSLSVKTLGDVTFRVKPHPMSRPSFFTDIVRKEGWSSNFEFAEGSMEHWLNQADILVTSGSATALEALAKGLPIVIIGREMSLALNPLDWFDIDYARVYYTSREILTRIKELLMLSDLEHEKLQKYGQALLRECFAPISEEGLQAFIPKQVRLVGSAERYK